MGASYEANQSELSAIIGAFDDRNEAIKRGLWIDGRRYEVHRHHPPLIYGRTMGLHPPEESEGFVVYKVELGVTGKPCFGAITYQMPNISAKMAPLLQSFCNVYLRAKEAESEA